MTATPEPTSVGPADPETTPSASYAWDLGRVESLTSRVFTTGSETDTTYTPVTGQTLAQMPLSQVSDVDEAFAQARVAAKAWSLTSVEHRQQLLLKFHDLVMERQKEIMDVVIWETGKARKHAYDEAIHIAMTGRYYGQATKRILAQKRAPGAVPGLTKVKVNHVPKGVVGIISPWNYPFSMVMCDGLAALAAGNAVVIKPDSKTMLTALIGAELLEEAGFPAGLWTVVSGPGSVIGTAVIERADYVCFTGSTNTGKIVAKGAAERLIGCSLELGGKNPLLVLRDANLKKAVDGAVRASFPNAGQLCISVERIYVHDSLYEEFREKFVAAVQDMKLAVGLDWGSDMGSLIDQSQLDAVAAHVDDARAKGATVLVGGKKRPDLGGYYYEPTVLEGVTPDMECFLEETFGPVVALYRFSDEADAVERANQGVHGLNASIWSKDTKRAHSIAERIKCGSVNINEAYASSFGSIGAPMGGMRDSGLGRRQGAEGLLRYTEPQTIATQRVLKLAPQFGLNDKQFAAIMSPSLKLLKKLGRP